MITRWPLAPQQEYMLANLAFRTADLGVRFRNPFLALRVTGSFDVDRFAAAVGVLARRHGVLRAELDATTSASMRLRDDPGDGYFEFDAETTDPDAALAAQEWQIFEPTRAPLWRVKVMRVAPLTHLVSLTFCHLIWDGLSMRAFLGLLSCEYANPGSTAEPQQYVRFVETAEEERSNRRSKGGEESSVLSAIADAIRERRKLCSEVAELDIRRLAFSIGREGMNRIRLTPSAAASTPFFTVLQAYLKTAAEAFDRLCLVTAFATSRVDLRPSDDCLGYFSDLSLGIFQTASALIDRPDSTVARHGPDIRLLSPTLSWSELTAAVGVAAYPQEIYDVWARGPVFTNASSWAEIFPGAQTALLSLTPGWRMAVTDANQRRILAGQVIPSVIMDDLREGTGHLEFNVAAVSRRAVRALAEDLVASIRYGERRSSCGTD